MNGPRTDAQRPARPVDAPAPRPSEVHKDVTLALALAKHGRAEGELVAALRRRLCGYIRGFAAQAKAFAASRPTVAERGAYASAVREAVAVADVGGRTGPNAADSLRQLGLAVQTVARMAAAHAQRLTDQQNPPV